MLLYALTDILPFPRQFIHHEIQTSSVECHDEMSLVAAELTELTKGVLARSDKGKGKDKALAIFEEDEAGIRSRTKVRVERFSLYGCVSYVCIWIVWHPNHDSHRQGRARHDC